MSKKRNEDTKTTEFEVDGIEEAYAVSPQISEHKKTKPGEPWRPVDLPKLEVETPPNFEEPWGHTAKIWILERRARGLLAHLKRWLVGKTRR